MGVGSLPALQRRRARASAFQSSARPNGRFIVMKFHQALLALAAGAMLAAAPVQAAQMSIVSGDTGNGLQVLREILDQFEKKTGNKVNIVPMPSSTTDQFGQYKLWLAAGNSDVDVYQTDVIWAPQLSNQPVDLTDATKDLVGAHFPSIIESQ